MKKSAFLKLWLSQTGSAFGSGITNFALGIWIYQQTGSLISFAAVMLCITLSNLLFTPISGWLTDKQSKKKMLVWCDFLQVIILAALFFSLSKSSNVTIIVYIVVSLRAILGKVQNSVFNTLPSHFSNEEETINKYVSLIQISTSARLFAPVAAGLLINYGLWLILALDIITFVISLLVILNVSIPKLKKSKYSLNSSSFKIRDLKKALDFLKNDTTLWASIFWVSTVYFSLATVSALFTPFVLELTDSSTLGMLFLAGGIAALLGSISFKKHQSSEMPLYSAITCGLFILGISLDSSIPWIFFMVFGYFYTSSFALISFNSYWHKKIPGEIQGRAFSIRDIATSIATPLGYLCSPWAVENLLEPALKDNPIALEIITQYTGYEMEQALLIMFFFTGICVISSTVCFHNYRRRKDVLRCV